MSREDILNKSLDVLVGYGRPGSKGTLEKGWSSLIIIWLLERALELPIPNRMSSLQSLYDLSSSIGSIREKNNALQAYGT